MFVWMLVTRLLAMTRAGLVAQDARHNAVHVACAWAFTALRIAHSLVQATINVVNIRFALFLSAWIALAVMIVRELLAVI